MQKMIMVAVLGLCLSTTSIALGAGFSLIEQSVSGLGTAYSGGAAAAEDASTLYFNPAGMVLLQGQEVIGGVHYIMPSAEFTKTSASNALGAPIPGGNGGDGGVSRAIPNFYYVKNLDKLAVGLGINVPFGLTTEYDKTWVGRYHAVNSDVQTLNLNPSVAFKVDERLSLGAGVSAQMFKVNLTNMVDFGLASGVGAIASNPNADIYADLKADSWGYGYNLGALYRYSDGGRVGLAYRSRITHKVKGDVDFTVQNPAFLTGVNPALLTAANASFPDQDISGKITLPATASLSLYQELNPQWALVADITWTEWSTFESLVINFDQGLGAGGATKQSVTTESWRDNWRYALGTTFQANAALTLRAGAAYDQTPISDDRNRTPRVPDNSRTWLAAGAGYALSEALMLNVGYAHLFVKESRMNKTITGPSDEDTGRGAVQGTFATSVDIASLEVVYRF
ncbi:MAG TPA: hypothetical protein DEB35_04490 [Desulfuromonas sp.]|nr:hypothetical protein [Desulfuromonas sp.]